MQTNRRRWSTEDYESLDWHDNHVHGVSLRAGQQGSGELTLDLDFILEWQREADRYMFLLAPATLLFHDVTDFVLELGYPSPKAAIFPFIINSLDREAYLFPNGYPSFKWSISVNYPEGFVSFVATGFTQVLRSEPTLVPEQHSSAEVRPSIGAV